MGQLSGFGLGVSGSGFRVYLVRSSEMVSRLSKCCAKFFFGSSTVSSFLSTSLPFRS